MNILIDKSWVEEEDADDILQHYKNHNIVIMESSMIKKMSIENFMTYIFFVPTTIVYNFFGNCIDTYDERFSKFFNRDIQKNNVDDIKTFPIFVKPLGNIKQFDGTIFNYRYQVDLCIPKNINVVYTSNVVKITNPVRLLIGNHRLYGYSKEYPDSKCIEKIIDWDFINDIKSITNEYIVIDVGIINEKWSVIELNPPYSFDSWEISLPEYFSFCQDACRYIAHRSKHEQHENEKNFK
jgi:hypothetical protein